MQVEERLPVAPEEHLSAEEQNKRLQVLVSELLKSNQELRFKVASLEGQVKSMKGGLEPATAWAALIF
jgi:hypothetical protein